jgi:hypothetical protein
MFSLPWFLWRASGWVKETVSKENRNRAVWQFHSALQPDIPAFSFCLTGIQSIT